MNEEAIKYLKLVCDPLTRNGVEVVQDERNPTAIAVIPKDISDYGALCGVKGANASTIRQIFRMWCGIHGFNVEHSNVQIANPQLIKTQHV